MKSLLFLILASSLATSMLFNKFGFKNPDNDKLINFYDDVTRAVMTMVLFIVFSVLIEMFNISLPF